MTDASPAGRSWLDVSLSRDEAIAIVVPVSIVAVVLSLGFALLLRFRYPFLLTPYGYILLGLWTLIPPLWFMFEWGLVKMTDKEQVELVKHYHELCRSFWLAFIVALGAIMGASDVIKSLSGH